MPASFSILALDLHNTIYDEVMEYGLALDEALRFWEALARAQGHSLSRPILYQELASAHRLAGSDWDGEVWHTLPCLQAMGLEPIAFSQACTQAQSFRLAKSKDLTVEGAYPDIGPTLAALKGRGVPIYVVTEATAEIAMQAISWLELRGIVDGVYSYPSGIPPLSLAGTYHKLFPELTGERLKKPHPFILAAILLDEGIRRGTLPDDLKLGDVFALSPEPCFQLPELSVNEALQKDVAARLTLKETPHKAVLQHLLDSLLYVGDSKFKDGFLARNAGIAFGHAAYGKKVKDGSLELQKRSLEIMYGVTGWDSETLKLTQEASRSDMVNRLQPDFIFENGPREILPLFE